MKEYSENRPALKLAIIATTTTLVSIGSAIFADKTWATTLIYDTFSDPRNVTISGYTDVTPHTYMGQAFNADPTFPYPNPIVNNVAAYFFPTQNANYKKLQLNVSFWDNFNPSATSVFSNLLASFSFNYGALNVSNSNIGYVFNPSFRDVTFTGLNNHGVTINLKADTGSGLVDTDNFASLLTFSKYPIRIGSNAASNGYYVNASGRTDSNFASGDLFINNTDDVFPYVSLGITLGYDAPTPTAVPEPFTVIGTIVGGTAALRMRKKLKSAKQM
jgi:hypothetical protein